MRSALRRWRYRGQLWLDRKVNPPPTDPLRRAALALELPPEVIAGLPETNHWSLLGVVADGTDFPWYGFHPAPPPRVHVRVLPRPYDWAAER